MQNFLASVVTFTKDAASRFQSVLADFFGGQTRHGIFDNAGIVNLFAGIGILNVEVLQEKAVASHPLEINSYIQDNVVTLPKVVVVTLAAEQKDIEKVYNLLDQLFTSDTTLLSVMVDTKLHTNLIIKSLPNRRDPEKFDLLEIPIVLHEYIFSRVKTTPMDDPANVELAEYSSRQQAGLQRPVTVSGQDAVRIQGEMTIPGGSN